MSIIKNNVRKMLDVNGSAKQSITTMGKESPTFLISPEITLLPDNNYVVRFGRKSSEVRNTFIRLYSSLGVSTHFILLYLYGLKHMWRGALKIEFFSDFIRLYYKTKYALEKLYSENLLKLLSWNRSLIFLLSFLYLANVL